MHRDIKPANVIITDNGAVKVMDFGIARALHGASTTMTQTGMVMGTPQYLSPEQALGKAVDHRSDLYATGCMLYELLALRPPFTGETPLSVVYQHVQDIPTPPSEVSDASPPELDGVVMRSLAKEPDDRFQTAEEMRGLIQYGLQMLYDQGGHTGTWNTGPVDMHDGGRTPAAGFAGTTAMPHPDASSTAAIPQPILPNRYGGGDDGGFEGGGNRGDGRGKLWIIAVLAVIAVVAVFFGPRRAVPRARAHCPGVSCPPCRCRPSIQGCRAYACPPTTATVRPSRAGSGGATGTPRSARRRVARCWRTIAAGSAVSGSKWCLRK
ncbi:Serine/threonine-protein kinase PknD [Streptomyces hirsutus]